MLKSKTIRVVAYTLLGLGLFAAFIALYEGDGISPMVFTLAISGVVICFLLLIAATIVAHLECISGLNWEPKVPSELEEPDPQVETSEDIEE